MDLPARYICTPRRVGRAQIAEEGCCRCRGIPGNSQGTVLDGLCHSLIDFVAGSQELTKQVKVMFDIVTTSRWPSRHLHPAGRFSVLTTSDGSNQASARDQAGMWNRMLAAGLEKKMKKTFLVQLFRLLKILVVLKFRYS